MPKIWFTVPDELRHLWRPILSTAVLRNERRKRKGRKLTDVKGRRWESQTVFCRTKWKTKTEWTWITMFNNGKCQIGHLGRTNPGWMDRLGSEMLGSSASERDLGILINVKLDMSQQGLVARRARCVLGCIRNSIILEILLQLTLTQRGGGWVWCLACVD